MEHNAINRLPKTYPESYLVSHLIDMAEVHLTDEVAAPHVLPPEELQHRFAVYTDLCLNNNSFSKASHY